MRLFSPWRYNVDAAGWAAPDDPELPTGAQLVEDYLEPLAKLPVLAAHLCFVARVVALTRPVPTGSAPPGAATSPS